MVKMAKKGQSTKEGQAWQTQVEELTNCWKRAIADYQNLEKRYEKEKSDFVQFANTNLILKLLTALDHLERVQAYLKDDGLDLAIKELRRVLTEEGLDETEVVGKEFNPEEMEAVELVDGEEERVVEVVNKGYKLKGRVIRVAKVKVGQKKKLPEPEGEIK